MPVNMIAVDDRGASPLVPPNRDDALRRAIRGSGLAIPVIAWVVAVAIGYALINRYSTTPGERGQPPGKWPSDSGLVRSPDRANLVMCVHPRCPCTRASMAELNEIVADHPGRMQVHILILKPAELPESWSATDIWKSAGEIPGARVVFDRNGAESRRFGAAASGHVTLFDRQGRLAFSGGVTPSRGHRGQNAGSQAVSDLLEDHPAASGAAVYGCPLFEKHCPAEDRR
ncbi:MAG TPA: hypothetical protein VGH74_22805 [Planctomycetaceae bacterium]